MEGGSLSSAWEIILLFSLCFGVGGRYNFKSPGKKIQNRKMAAYQTKKGNGWWAEKTSQKKE